MTNTSATGGYVAGKNQSQLPGQLTLEQFIQTVIVGITGYSQTFVRPKWQVAPPKQPDIMTDWIAFSLISNTPDSYAYTGLNSSNETTLQRNQALEIQIAFYGPNAQENIALFMDGLQIPQNLAAMTSVKMGYTSISGAIRGPDLVGERWIDRYEMSLTLTRQVLRTYPILSFASASGTIHTVVQGQAYEEPFK